MPKPGHDWLPAEAADRYTDPKTVGLRLFLDSADLQAWSELWPLGLFQGITTNPTLLQSAGVACNQASLAKLAREAWDLGCQELQLQAWGSSSAEFLDVARGLLDLSPERIVVKLPLTEAGLLAAKLLLKDGAKVTLTACYSTPQVLTAAALGSTYVAPYLGRIHDQGRDGFEEVLKMQQSLVGVGSSTRLLVASLRSTEDLSRLTPIGINTFTLSPSLARQLWRHPATEAAALKFQEDAVLSRSRLPNP